MRDPRHRVLTGLLVLAAAACGGPPVDLPEPDLSEAEPEVAEFVRRAQEAVREAPGSAEAWAALGDRYRAHSWWTAAAEAYEQAASREPDNFLWSYLAADCLRYEYPERAEPAFRRALEIDDTYAPVHVYFARMLSRLGREDEAEAHFRRAYQLDRGSQHALLGLGRVALSRERFDDAVASLQEALRLDPDFGEAHAALSQAYLAQGVAALAEVHGKRAKALPKETPLVDPLGVRPVEPAGAMAHHTRGHDIEDTGDLQAAFAEYQLAIDNNPEFGPAYYDLGRLYSAWDDPELSEQNLRRAIELKPGHVESHIVLGTVLYGQGRWAEAEGPLREALDLAPERPGVHYHLGVVLTHLDRPDEAEEQFETAIAMRPEEASNYAGLGDAQVLAGRDAAAAASYRTALERSPGVTPTARLAARGLAWVLATTPEAGVRDPATAVTWAERAAGGAAEATSQDVLGAAYAAAGRYDDAVRAAEQAASLARAAGDEPLVAAIEERLALYRQGRPYRR